MSVGDEGLILAGGISEVVRGASHEATLTALSLVLGALYEPYLSFNEPALQERFFQTLRETVERAAITHINEQCGGSA